MTSRIVPIDWLKAFAILTVILIHSLSDFGEAQPAYMIRLRFLTRYAVPAFFFASGFLSFRAPSASWNVFLRTRCLRVMVPYAISSIIALVFLDRWFGDTLTIRSATIAIATGSALGIYYFVPVLLGALVLGHVIRPYPGVWGPLWGALFVLGLGTESRVLPSLGSFFLDFRNPLRWWTYFMSGYFIAASWGHIGSISCRMARVVASSALAVGGTGFAIYLSYLPGGWSAPTSAFEYLTIHAIVVAILFATIHARRLPWVQWLSEATYPIYLYHFLFILLARIYMGGPSMKRLLVCYLFGLGGAIAVVALGRRFLGRYSRLLLG